jgi:hypothetical protein
MGSCGAVFSSSDITGQTLPSLSLKQNPTYGNDMLSQTVVINLILKSKPLYDACKFFPWLGMLSCQWTPHHQQSSMVEEVLISPGTMKNHLQHVGLWPFGLCTKLWSVRLEDLPMSMLKKGKLGHTLQIFPTPSQQSIIKGHCPAHVRKIFLKGPLNCP